MPSVSDGITVAEIVQLGRMAQWQEALTALGPRGALPFDHCSAMVAACGRGGKWQMAMLLLADHVRRFGPRSNVVVYTAAITACARGVAWAAAFDILAEMQHQRVAGNHFTCSAAISACQATSRWHDALNLLDQRGSNEVFTGLQPNLVICNGILSACERAGEWQRVLWILETGMFKSRLQPDLISYVTAMTAINGAAKVEGWEMTLQLLESMCENHIEANVAIQNAALSACARGGQWRLVLHSLRQLGPLADEVTYGTAMHAAVLGSAWQQSMALFEEMRIKRQLRSNTIILNTLLSACEMGSQWRQALHLVTLFPREADAMSFGHVAAACCGSGQCQMAVQVLRQQKQGCRQAAGDIAVAAMNACARKERWREMLMWFQGLRSEGIEGFLNGADSAAMMISLSWDRAFQLLRRFEALQVQADLVTQSSAMAAAQRARGWQSCAAFMQKFQEERMESDRVVTNTYICSLETSDGQRWPRALHMLQEVNSFSAIDVRSFTAVTVACIAAGHWQLALQVSSAMARRLHLDLVGFDSVISTCSAVEQPALGQFYLWQSETLRSPWSFLWALAELHVEDPEVIHAACVEAGQAIRNSGADPADLAKFLWCISVLGASNPIVQQAVARMLLPQLGQLELLHLAEVAYSATDPQLLLTIQALLIPQLPHLEQLTLAKDGRYVLSLVRSACLADMLLLPFRQAVQRTLRHLGSALDVKATEAPVAKAPSTEVSQVSLVSIASSPLLLRGLTDRAVLYKPEGWEVYGNHSKLQLVDFAVEALGQRPIFANVAHNCGFLHRLDIPSSGLIIAATTFEAFYDLQMQLVSGQMLREYLALLHGTWPSWGTQLETLQVPQVERPTRSGGRGKPCRTTLNLLEHLQGPGGSLSQVSLHIGTGRKHQIRSHLAHVGHPVLRDALYSSTATFEADAVICARNWLHRRRLVFQDLSGEPCEVCCPLPVDLRNSTRQVRQVLCCPKCWVFLSVKVELPMMLAGW